MKNKTLFKLIGLSLAVLFGGLALISFDAFVTGIVAVSAVSIVILLIVVLIKYVNGE